MAAYYNEFDPKAAAWLRELIRAGHIADGIVDERSISDVRADELMGFTQCHFFAGIGVWSHALRMAGWPDERPVWTGSCPCQPFSAAGKQLGTDDHRHLWPVFGSLIAQCRPPVVFGEQVASKAGREWFNSVRLDLEAVGYGVGGADLCAAGVGAPHIRQRLYFCAESVADTTTAGLQGGLRGRADSGREDLDGHAGCSSAVVGMAVTESLGSGEGQQNTGGCAERGAAEQGAVSVGGGNRVQLGNPNGEGRTEQWGQRNKPERFATAGVPGWMAITQGSTSPTNGFWSSPDWLYCRDGKWRPVESGTFPLAHGAPARVGRLRGYGNAIVAPLAQAFIESYMHASIDTL